MSTTAYVFAPICPECFNVEVRELTLHLADHSEQYYQCPQCGNQWKLADGQPSDRWRWDQDKP